MTVTIDGTNGVSKVAANAVDNAGLQANAVTQPKVAAGVAGNGPTFSARSASHQTLSAGSYTKIVFGAENWDTANCFDTSLSRFTPNLAGYYLVTTSVEMSAGTSLWVLCSIYKNGSAYTNGTNYPEVASAGPTSVATTTVYMNGTTDYLEVYAGMSGGGTAYAGANTNFTGFLARAA